jgi:hypothetical protein
MITFRVLNFFGLKEYSIRRYEAHDYATWNAFISTAKNATFLFHRDFMEYHGDRFDDFSLLIFDAEKLVAVLPANRVGDAVFSHQGLTYGGLVYADKLKLASVITIFKRLLHFLNQISIDKIYIKTIPGIYHHKPAEELLYALFLVEGKLISRESLLILDLRMPLKLSKDRLAGVSRGSDHGLVVKEEDNFDLFWNSILLPNLANKYQSAPVHTLEEIKFLYAKFPKNIRQFNVYYQDEIVAGTTIFESDLVARSQYTSANDEKNVLGSLDFLHKKLLTEVFKDKVYFDFGTSNQNQGKKLNHGLSYWKESFGGNTIIQDFYEVETSKFYLLENVLT